MTVLDTANTVAPAWLHTLAAPLKTTLQHPWVASIIGLGAVEDALSALHPMLSLCAVRARVLRVVAETPSTKTFLLQPNALWNGAQAGQFIRVLVEIDGRLTERVYSLSSRPGARRLAITVKRQGLVSRHLHDTLKPGAVITISQAAGDFVLPSHLPEKILLLSAGSGITPVMAMLRDLKARNYRGDVVFLHTSRNAQEAIYAERFQALARDFPALHLRQHFTQEAGRLDAAALKSILPDLAQRSTWMCGPAAMMDAVHRLWVDENFAAPLHSERFAAPPLFVAAEQGSPVAVNFVASGRQFTTEGADVLLVQAERAGLTPKYGCRIGICRSCQCMKKSGTVENLQTGEISSAPNELIRLCISAARSDLSLDL